MECKVDKINERNIVLFGFNRDIVECKVLQQTLRVRTAERFNRDIVECKDAAQIFGVSVGNYDLIETLWNVKWHILQIPEKSLLDLIETLWNVKVRIQQLLFAQIKI